MDPIFLSAPIPGIRYMRFRLCEERELEEDEEDEDVLADSADDLACRLTDMGLTQEEGAQVVLGAAVVTGSGCAIGMGGASDASYEVEFMLPEHLASKYAWKILEAMRDGNISGDVE